MLEKTLVAVPGGSLSVTSVGNGPAVIFLHGGPGDTHDYMRRMAEPLFERFQCVFFDQRGTGGSSNFKRSPEQFTVDLHLADLTIVQNHFDLKQPALIGHSWGAMYALFACIQFPNEFSRAALLNMGPLDKSMGEQTAAHLLAALSPSEQIEWPSLRHERNLARDKGDVKAVHSFDHKLMRLRVKAWVFNPALRDVFLREYFEDPPPDREVNKWVWSDVENWFSWSMLERVKTELWVCSGANDSVPLAQTERLVQNVSGASATILDECGHIPWLEHPVGFYAGLQGFLSGKTPRAPI